jgi:DNA-binding SARP family transcriptional activator
LRFQLLGRPCWRTETAEAPLQAKFAALVACVAVGGRQARDAVARQLWPGDLDRARDNLRQHVTRLRKATGHTVFIQDESIELCAGVDCDTAEDPARWPLQALLEERQCLAGIEYPGLSGLKAWLEHQRQRWNALIGDALLQRCGELESAAELAQALRLAGRATEIAPWLEAGWRTRMRLQYLAGDHAAAAHTFTQLKLQLGPVHATPGAETLALWRTIERGGTAPPRPATIPASLLRPPVLVGREPQWAAMEAAWQLRRPFLLRGEAGIGKTRLLFDFARQHGAAVLVSGRKGDAHAP